MTRVDTRLFSTIKFTEILCYENRKANRHSNASQRLTKEDSIMIVEITIISLVITVLVLPAVVCSRGSKSESTVVSSAKEAPTTPAEKKSTTKAAEGSKSTSTTEKRKTKKE